jgi:hypothetical protein
MNLRIETSQPCKSYGLYRSDVLILLHIRPPPRSGVFVVQVSAFARVQPQLQTADIEQDLAAERACSGNSGDRS